MRRFICKTAATLILLVVEGSPVTILPDSVAVPDRGTDTSEAQVAGDSAPATGFDLIVGGRVLLSYRL